MAVESGKAQKNLDEVRFLTSNSYRMFLEKIVRGISGNYSLKLIFSDDVYTDGNVVSVNPIHPYVMKIKGLSQKTLCILGQLAHEVFHILYTDFLVLEKLKKEYSPLGDFRMQQMHNCLNIIEDAAIELVGTNYYTGSFKQGIIANNKNALDNMPSLDEMAEQQAPRLAIFQQACAMYCILGTLKGKLHDPEMLELFQKAMPIMDKGRLAPNTWKRLEAAKELYNLMEPLIAEAEKQGQQQTVQQAYKYTKNRKISSGGTNSRPQSQPQIYQDFQQEQREATQEEIKEQIKQVQQNEDNIKGNNKNNKNESDEVAENNKEDEDAELKEILKQFDEQLEEVKKEFVQEEYDRQEQIKRDKEIREFAKSVSYDSLHKHIKVEIQRRFNVDDNVKERYNADFSQIRNLARNMAKNILDVIRFNEDVKVSGLYSGRVNKSQLSRVDKRVFYQRKEKSEEADLAILMLVDQSNSMSGDRIRYARLACMMMYEVCSSLNIPFAVIGHSAVYHRDIVIHRHFIDFDSKNPDEKYNLGLLVVHENTREGVSLKYAGEYLMRRPEKDKILIAISDGDPYHPAQSDTYTDDIAQKDTARVVKYLEANGIKVFGLAIGDGKSVIKKIYTQNYIDIPSVQLLPVRLISLLRRHIFK